MLGARRNGWDRRKSVDFDDGGYVETDPTGRYGRYEDVLGKGAMKTVYRAFDELQGIEVAWNQARICDVLRSPEALERLYSEVHLLATLNHDSIISFHSSWVDTENRTFNFITEMFTSGTLREYRQRYRRVDIRAVKNWARQILHGLVYLHSHDPPVIHRDLKCDNVFVNGHLGQVKIGDLGLAAVLKGSQQAHSVIGTPEFMAPELYDEEYNELVDTYSFGMCVLEMLTGEYPYSECSNPAQIYKKVTLGRLPNAFYEIKDPEAQLFIGRCLENVSKRPSAWELLLDPFLQLENAETPSHMATGLSYALSECQVPPPSSPIGQKKMSTDMKITGKINPDDDTIYLRVQIADKNGSATNVYFPFDINSDTPIDVANEMVKELEIMDCDSSLIAEVIDREISSLVPHWKDEVPADIYDYHEEDDSFHNYPSSATSSQDSSFSRMHPVGTECRPSCDWLQDMFDDDDDTVSQTSTYSGKYTYLNYSSGYEHDSELSPWRQEIPPPPLSNKSSRFCHEESTRYELYCSNKPVKECSFFVEPLLQSSHAEKRSSVKGKLLRNRSFVDIRSQLLHRSLVQELNNRLSKTVGSVESVHYPEAIYRRNRGSNREKNLLGACNNLEFSWKRSYNS